MGEYLFEMGVLIQLSVGRRTVNNYQLSVETWRIYLLLLAINYEYRCCVSDQQPKRKQLAKCEFTKYNFKVNVLIFNKIQLILYLASC